MTQPLYSPDFNEFLRDQVFTSTSQGGHTARFCSRLTKQLFKEVHKATPFTDQQLKEELFSIHRKLTTP